MNATNTMQGNYCVNDLAAQENQRQMAIKQAVDQANIRLYEKSQEAMIEVAKKREMEELRTREEETRAKLRADVASRRELHRTWPVVLEDGHVQIVHRFFSGTETGKSSILVRDCRILECEEAIGEEILFVTFEKPDGRPAEIHFRTIDLKEPVVNRKLDRFGIRFGFGRRKEAELRMALISALVSQAPHVTIPPHHGWYLCGKKWKYAFEEEIVWEEVSSNV